ncbi:hypothetical protein [uncultured Acinetobacter sp.]|uniref:hypothetical protein n=2 Tax=uncultured Acinetobacter sp. TaxID=165433 RepID=UPI00258D1818|nr:hypothetical protein [uncultured Acinetobacter sp.]
MPRDSLELRMTDINTIDEEGNELLNEFEYTPEELAEINALEEQDKLNQIDASGKPVGQSLEDDELDDEFLNDLTQKPEDINADNNLSASNPNPIQEKQPEAVATPTDPATQQPEAVQQDLPEFEDHTEELAELTQQKEDAQGQIDDVLEKLEKLGEDFDNGEIGQGKYEAQKIRLQRELNQCEAQLAHVENQHSTLSKTSAEQTLSRQEAINQAWANDAKAFIDKPENELLKNNPNMAHAFDQTLVALGQAGQLEGLSNHKVLETVRAAMAIRYPELNKAVERPQEKKSKPTHEGFVPPVSLASVPSVDIIDDIDPFAHINKLSGIAYEIALSKLTPQQLREYYGSDYSDD